MKLMLYIFQEHYHNYSFKVLQKLRVVKQKPELSAARFYYIAYDFEFG